MSFNKITIVGNLGSDPELRLTPQGVNVCTLSVATTEKGKNGQPDATTWFRATFWRQQAEMVAKFFKKGEPIYLEGKLSTREWQDKEGKTRTSLEVSATNFEFLGVGKKNEDSNEGYQQPQQSQTRFPSNQAPSNAMAASAGSSVSDEDIPF